MILTSIMKIIDAAVANSIKAASEGALGGTDYVGTLNNGGVGLAPYHDLASVVPADLDAAVQALKAEIIAGTVKVADYLK